MVNWGKRPEFDEKLIPKWRKRLDYGILAVGLSITVYNLLYVGLGLYYGQIGRFLSKSSHQSGCPFASTHAPCSPVDHEQEKKDLRALDNQIHRRLWGKSVAEMPGSYQQFHQQVSLLELASKLRSEQQPQQPVSSQNESESSSTPQDSPSSSSIPNR